MSSFDTTKQPAVFQNYFSLTLANFLVLEGILAIQNYPVLVWWHHSGPGAANPTIPGGLLVWGSGLHLYSAGGGICLLGGDPRWVLSQSGGLGSGSYTSGTAHHRGAVASHRAPTARTRPGASLGSGVSIRSRGIYSHPREVPHGSEHESAGKRLRQCQLRKLHEDPEAGRNLRQQVR